MTQYAPRDFYGGAIKGLIPQSWVDASDVREVPDHQEVFLSPTTLTSQIVEINQRVSADETTSLSHLLPSTSTPDEAAALYHIHDICDEDDKLEIVTGPTSVSMGKLLTSGISAYRGVVRVTSPKKQGRGTEVARAAVAGSSAEGLLTSTVSLHYLLVRLGEQETDLVVFVNVPHEEFEKAGDLGGLEGEEGLARGLIGGLVEVLEVVDWGLFT